MSNLFLLTQAKMCRIEPYFLLSHGVARSRLLEVKGDKPDKQKFKTSPDLLLHIDFVEVCTAEGKLYLYVAIDRTSKFPFVQLLELKKAGTRNAVDDLIDWSETDRWGRRRSIFQLSTVPIAR